MGSHQQISPKFHYLSLSTLGSCLGLWGSSSNVEIKVWPIFCWSWKIIKHTPPHILVSVSIRLAAPLMLRGMSEKLSPLSLMITVSTNKLMALPFLAVL